MRAVVRGYRGKGFGSGFIKRFTFGGYSHVSLVFAWEGKTTECESIQRKGVVAHKPNDGDFDELSIPISEADAEKLYFSCLDLVGAEYDWSGVWGFVRRKLKHDPFKWFCSEYVAYLLLMVGYPLSRREPYRETPSSVMESLRLIEGVAEVGSA